jgi:hypothetical protein
LWIERHCATDGASASAERRRDDDDDDDDDDRARVLDDRAIDRRHRRGRRDSATTRTIIRDDFTGDVRARVHVNVRARNGDDERWERGE